MLTYSLRPSTADFSDLCLQSFPCFQDAPSQHQRSPLTEDQAVDAIELILSPVPAERTTRYAGDIKTADVSLKRHCECHFKSLSCFAEVLFTLWIVPREPTGVCTHAEKQGVFPRVSTTDVVSLGTAYASVTLRATRNAQSTRTTTRSFCCSYKGTSSGCQERNGPTQFNCFRSLAAKGNVSITLVCYCLNSGLMFQLERLELSEHCERLLAALWGFKAELEASREAGSVEEDTNAKFGKLMAKLEELSVKLAEKDVDYKLLSGTVPLILHRSNSNNEHIYVPPRIVQHNEIVLPLKYTTHCYNSLWDLGSIGLTLKYGHC